MDMVNLFGKIKFISDFKKKKKKMDLGFIIGKIIKKLLLGFGKMGNNMVLVN